MSKIQVQGVHHITFVGSNRETTIDFYEGVLGMPHRIRVAAGDYNIGDRHLADAINELVERRTTSLTASGVKSR